MDHVELVWVNMGDISARGIVFDMRFDVEMATDLQFFRDKKEAVLFACLET